jgi:hypothetical protein
LNENDVKIALKGKESGSEISRLERMMIESNAGSAGYEINDLSADR